jgi:hypothetical protein
MSIEDRLDEFERKLKQQQFELEIKYNFPYIHKDGKWLDRRGMISVESITSEVLKYSL